MEPHWPGHQFSSFEKNASQNEIKVYLEFRFNHRSVSLNFQLLTEKPGFECTFAQYPMMFLSYLVKNSVDMSLWYTNLQIHVLQTQSMFYNMQRRKSLLIWPPYTFDNPYSINFILSFNNVLWLYFSFYVNFM